MKYTVISSSSIRELEVNVTRHLKEQWELQGGISIVSDRDGNEYYAQAMTKKERDSGIQHMIDGV